MVETGSESNLAILDYQDQLKNGKLMGYACTHCGRKQITFIARCPECGHNQFQRFETSGNGVLESFTHQNVASELYKDKVPYAYVIVALEEGVKTSGWMAVAHASDLRIGMPVRYLRSDSTGCQFEPIATT